MKDLILDIRDLVLYDLLKRPLPEPPSFTYKHEVAIHREKGGGFWLESKDFPGLIASGDTLEELREALLDSILTYFDVPRAVAKRLPDQLILKLPNGKVIKPQTPVLPSLEVKVAFT